MDADRPASLLIERAAGPATPVRMHVALAEPDRNEAPAAPCEPWRIALRDVTLAIATPNADCAVAPVPAAATATLLDALRASAALRVDDGRGAAMLSVAGASAVLLKMDEVQGRLGAPGALIRRGRRDESTVPGPRPPIRVVHVVPSSDASTVSEASAWRKANRETLMAAMRRDRVEDDCPDLHDDEAVLESFEILPLDRTHWLASARCWRGAYQESFAYWQVPKSRPDQPVLITDAANHASDGVITGSFKGRGIGDCWVNDAWTWDGTRFVHTHARTTGLCRGIAAGGVWSMPTRVSEVIRR
jgi:hypothetical protein